MDFFPDISENAVFSIADMIDYDVKVGVDGSDDLLTNCDMDLNLSANFDIMSNFDSKFDSLSSWLQLPDLPVTSASNATSVKVEPILSGQNNMDNLLVNPQSVLPVSVPVAVVLPQPAVSTSLLTTQQPTTSFQIPASSANNITVVLNNANSQLPFAQQRLKQQLVDQILLQQQNQRNTPSVLQAATPMPAKVVPPALQQHVTNPDQPAQSFPKPVYSYSCLIAMALKNSDTGALPVNEIYNFILENFPFFKTAPDGWKNSVRHNLSLNKCFEKVDLPGKMAGMGSQGGGGSSKKGCLWGLNPSKVDKMDEEIIKWRKKDPEAVRRSLSNPDMLEMLEKGLVGCRPMQHVVSSSTPNIHLNINSSGVSTSISLPSMGAGKMVVGKAVSILPKDVLEIKPVKHIGVSPELLGGIQKFDNIFADLTGALNVGLLQTDAAALSHVLSNGGIGNGPTLVALLPTTVNIGSLLDSGAASVLTPQHLLTHSIATLS